MTIIHTESINQDLFYSIEDANPSIGITLQRNDINVGDLILFEELKYFLCFPYKTGRDILTKVIRIEQYTDEKYGVIVENIDNYK